jgi:hypothetical protein
MKGETDGAAHRSTEAAMLTPPHRCKNGGPGRQRDFTNITLVDCKSCGLVLASVDFRTWAGLLFPSLGAMLLTASPGFSEPFVFMSVRRVACKQSWRPPVSIKLTRVAGGVWKLSAEQPPVKLT